MGWPVAAAPGTENIKKHTTEISTIVLIMKYLLQIIKRTFAIAVGALLIAGCSKDDTDAAKDGYGYVQFHLYKSGSYATTRANNLEYLNEAAKIKITFRDNEHNSISSTVNVTAANNHLSEWGMQSEKIQLLADSYTIVGYQILDKLDRIILSDEPLETTIVQVIPGGLVLQDVILGVTERGWVNFQLIKDNSELPSTRAIKDGADEHPFHKIVFADVTVKNLNTNMSTKFEGLKMKHEFVRSEEDERYHTSICKTDTLLSLRAGRYQVTEFRTYFDDTKKVFESSTSAAANGFEIKDNQTVKADVPVTLHVTSAYIADALALKEIWEALDGPNWKVKWDFNRDIDLWTAQPGVQEDGNTGRIASLNLDNVGARGEMPAALGKLTGLISLSIGAENFYGGQSNVKQFQKYVPYTEQQKEASRRAFMDVYFNNDPRQYFSKELEAVFDDANFHIKKYTGVKRALPRANDPVNYSSMITKLPEEIANLKKLEYLTIAYCPIATLPAGIASLEALTDLTIINCPNLTEFPQEVAELGNLEALRFSCNYGVPAQSMYDGLDEMNKGAAATKLQAIYIPGQPLEAVPDLTKMKALGSLNIYRCGVKEFEVAFGKDGLLGIIIASENEIETLPVDGEGYFIGIENEIENFDFSHNKFTELPDIFSAKSNFKILSINFSHNQISSIGRFNGGEYRGMVVEALVLGQNKFTTFPPELFNSNSTINWLQLQGCGIEDIEDDALVGENTASTVTIELSFNKLTKLPDKFNVRTFPMLFGLDLSSNRFTDFPRQIFPALGTFVFRHQRDANGNRCMKDWPDGIDSFQTALRRLYLGSNNFGKVDKMLSPNIYLLDIKDNPNISIDVSSVCPYIKAGRYFLFFDEGQDIRGCDAIRLERP